MEQHVNNRTMYAVLLRENRNNYGSYTRENPLGHTFEFFKDGKLLSARAQNFVELTTAGIYKTRVDGSVYSSELCVTEELVTQAFRDNKYLYQSKQSLQSRCAYLD